MTWRIALLIPSLWGCAKCEDVAVESDAWSEVSTYGDVQLAHPMPFRGNLADGIFTITYDQGEPNPTPIQVTLEFEHPLPGDFSKFPRTTTYAREKVGST
jgi:hypothetical protein